MNSDPLIFIVDDDKAFNRLLESNFKKNGFQNINCFYSGEDCIKHFNLDPDIIVLDYNLMGLGNMDGLQTLERINKIFKNPTVIMVSGEMHEHAKKILEAKFEKGIYKYIMKDKNTLKELINTVQELLS